MLASTLASADLLHSIYVQYVVQYSIYLLFSTMYTIIQPFFNLLYSGYCGPGEFLLF
jgi:hypothetical protein